MLKACICQVLPALEIGGVERGTVDISRAVVQSGSTSLVLSSGGRLVKLIKQEGGHHIQLPLASKNPWRMIQNIIHLRKLIREKNVCLLHARSRAPAWSAFFAAKSLKVPFVTTYHGIYNAHFFLKKFYNSIMVKGKVVIAPSVFVRNHILKTYGYHLAPKIRVIHRGVDLNIFKPSQASDEKGMALRQQWGVKKFQRLVLMSSRLSRWKGHEDFIAAMTHLYTTQPQLDILAVIVGQMTGRETYVKELQTLIQSFRQEENIKIVPAQSDMAAVYSAADLVVTPSQEPEAFGRVTAEAQAMEKAVIATSHGGAQEIILHEKTGWLVPVGDILQIAETIKTFFCLSNEDQKRMGQEGRKRIEKHFSLKQMQDETLSVYHQLCSPEKDCSFA